MNALLRLAEHTTEPRLKARLLAQGRRQLVHERIRNCHRCELRQECKQPVPFTGPAPCLIAFVVGEPSTQDDKAAIPLTLDTHAGRNLNLLLSYLQLVREHVAIVHAVNCFPGYVIQGRNEKPRIPDLTHILPCRENLTAQLDLIQPEVICWMGPTATLASGLFKEDVKIEAARKASPVKVGNRTHVFTHHPGVLTKEPELIGEMVNDFSKVEVALEGVMQLRMSQVFPAADLVTTSFQEACRKTGEMFGKMLESVPATQRRVEFYRLLQLAVSMEGSPVHMRALFDEGFAMICGAG